MKTWLLSIALLSSSLVQAQDETVKKLKAEAAKKIKKETADTIQKIWKTGGVYNLNLSQGSLTNWAAGGDKFMLSVNSLLSLFTFYKREKHSWDNTLDFNFGYLRSSSLGNRKNDDRLDLLSKYGYAIGDKWNVAALFNFRTQIAKGYTFPDDVKTFSSTFLAPGYVLFSLGMDYKPARQFSVFLSPATVRWVIVKNDSLSAKGLYGVEKGKKSRSELGAFFSASYLTNTEKKISYDGRLDLFSNYRHNPQNIDVFMSNVLAVKLSKLLSATWNVDLIYVDDVRLFGTNGTSPAWQVKSLVGVGLMLKF